MKKKRSIIALGVIVLMLPVVLLGCTRCGSGNGNGNGENDDTTEPGWWNQNQEYVTDAHGNRVTDDHGNFVTHPQGGGNNYV